MQNESDVASFAATLLREGRNSEAISFLKGKGNLQGKARAYLCDAYFQSRDWERAYLYCKEMLDAGERTPYNLKLQFKILNNMGRWREALPAIESYLGQFPNDIEAVSVAKNCLYSLGDEDRALVFGQMSLALKDAQSRVDGRKLRRNLPGKNVIAFSVWGDNKAYLLGAAINCVLCERYFKDWVVRIYTTAALDEDILNLYLKLGVELVFADKDFPGVPPYFWRFLASADPAVYSFLCRDADSRLSHEESELVGQWKSSGKLFHVIRDHVLHDDLILAGMWGGISSIDIDIQSLLDAYFQGKPTNKYGHDQMFLGKFIWPLVKRSVFVHDRHYWTPGVKSFRHSFDNQFGSGYQNEMKVIDEAKRLGLI
jgi:tetratricopeptide (TPR) repeat protein